MSRPSAPAAAAPLLGMASLAAPPPAAPAAAPEVRAPPAGPGPSARTARPSGKREDSPAAAASLWAFSEPDAAPAKPEDGRRLGEGIAVLVVRGKQADNNNNP